jgi:CspA family cold shock protein
LDRAIEERIEMPQGTVKMFRTDKGFGFITPDEGGADVYVHVSELEKTGLSGLSTGQKVTFEVERDPVKGKMRAVNVHVT